MILKPSDLSELEALCTPAREGVRTSQRELAQLLNSRTDYTINVGHSFSTSVWTPQKKEPRFLFLDGIGSLDAEGSYLFTFTTKEEARHFERVIRNTSYREMALDSMSNGAVMGMYAGTAFSGLVGGGIPGVGFGAVLGIVAGGALGGVKTLITDHSLRQKSLEELQGCYLPTAIHSPRAYEFSLIKRALE